MRAADRAEGITGAREAAPRVHSDRTPKPCAHKEAQHAHGTYACYVLDFCRCHPCAKANRDYEAERVRQQAYGRWDNYVDAHPAREHIRTLTDQGMGLKRIVAVSDISQGLLWKLVYGKRRTDGTRTPSKRVRKDTLERILAIELDLAAGAAVESTGTARRIQALVALGWSPVEDRPPHRHTAVEHQPDRPRQPIRFRRYPSVRPGGVRRTLHEVPARGQPPRQNRRIQGHAGTPESTAGCPHSPGTTMS